MAAGTGLPPALLKYWTAGEGATKIRWNTPGDFDRCVRAIGAEAKTLTPNILHGLCSTLHVVATGARPGHASGDKAGH